MFARFAVAVLLASIVGACSSGSEAATETTAAETTAVASETTVAADTTAPAATAAPTTTEPVFFYGPDPRAAIEALIGAWRAGNREGALLVADPTSVDNIFTQSAEGFELYGCDSGEFDTSNCNYRNRGTGGYAQITAEKQPQGWLVTSVYMSTDG